MKKFVITIARQYGSGGRTIGQMLAKELGVEYYDKDLITKASEESGINVALFANADEKSGKVFRLFKKKRYGGKVLNPSDSRFTGEENLFNYQAKIIKDLADKESCIIIGRAADYILKDRDDVISVFVHAPMDFLIEQAGKKHSMSKKELEKYIIKTDKARADYYYSHTKRQWTDARNYDLCLDSSKLGFEKCVEEIKAYMDVKFK
ncbi:MAG: cytidylate kinase-like family protein [Lachnospiraceae bacterium]|jgi:cytidylate kinase|nr:cytidylate kinase-like family protein [Lachnospiraceae bacterium]MBP5598821.1 cytidylate kinase-like family protein [Lachnospiraceae bacterium]